MSVEPSEARGSTRTAYSSWAACASTAAVTFPSLNAGTGYTLEAELSEDGGVTAFAVQTLGTSATLPLSVLAKSQWSAGSATAQLTWSLEGDAASLVSASKLRVFVAGVDSGALPSLSGTLTLAGMAAGKAQPVAIAEVP